MSARLQLPRKRTSAQVRDVNDLASQTFRFESDVYTALEQLRAIVDALPGSILSLRCSLDCATFSLVNAGLVQGAPTAFAWASGVASLDVSLRNDFVATNVLSANSVLTLIGGYDGCQGSIYVKQDGTGSRTLSFTVSGRTILREEASADSNPQTAANSLTGYAYDFKTIAGTAYVIIERFRLT